MAIRKAISGLVPILFLLASGASRELRAEFIAVGLIGFDVQVPPEGQQLGVNVINISNFTGSAFLPPDFPITTALSLNNLSLTILTPGGSQFLALGNLAPGDLPSTPSLQFASNFLINSVTLQATLSQTAFQSNGLDYAASSSTLLYVLLPSSGDFLQAGIDFGIFDINASPTAIPEPSTISLTLLAGLSFFMHSKGKAGR